MTADVPIALLARKAGLEIEWTDAAGVAQHVGDDALAALVDALGWPCGTAAERADSAAALTCAAAIPSALVTCTAGTPLALPCSVAPPGAPFRIALETGDHVDGRVARAGRCGALPPLSEAGYHVLEVGTRGIALAIAPRARTFSDTLRTCGANGCWGIAVQLYRLRRAHDGGCGDFTALAQLAVEAARHGAQAVAISPTHALFPARPEHESPYSPSSRRWVNVAYIDPDAIPADGPARAWAGFDDVRDVPLIDWPRVLPARMSALRARFDDWRAHGSGTFDAFRRFQDAGGAALDAHACFDALHACCIRDGLGADWRRWPAPLRQPTSPETHAFARAHHDAIAFHAFLQWRADCGLAAAQRAARRAGMAIGLIADLAVGSDRAGSDAWVHGATLLNGVSLGAPPDMFNGSGQDWGVTTWTPDALRAAGFAPFIDLLRGALAHAGGIRIDHVLGFARIWIVPDGARPRDGAYLRYPCDDLLRLVALETSRHRAIAIGEDLGTVPAGFRARLASHGIGGMRALWFERDDDGAFRLPDAWERDVVATTSTHDLPTVAGWWQGVDLRWRRVAARADNDTGPAADREAEAGPDNADGREIARRAADRGALWHALRRARCVPAGRDMPPCDTPPVAAVLAYVARSRSSLAMFPLEDLLALDAQPNLPGPPCGHPNWRRRLPGPIATLFDGSVRTRIAAIARERRKRRRSS